MMNLETTFFFSFMSGNILFFILTVQKVATLNKGKEKILKIKEETSEVPLDAKINMNMKGKKDLKNIQNIPTYNYY